MKTAFSLLVLVLAVGCASFGTRQRERRWEDGKMTTEIITRAGSRTFFDSESQLANFKAAQSENMQSAEVGGLMQKASGTNVVALIEAASKALAEAAAALKTGMVPTP